MTSTLSDTRNSSCISDRTAGDTDVAKVFVLAHCSDPHFAKVDHINTSDFFSKRLFGYLRWKLKRRAEHSDELLTILFKDLQRTKPDHIAITGDLTQLGLPIEFKRARDWLQTLGTADRVTAIPGNHDTYVKTNWHETFAQLLDYMAGDVLDQPTDSTTSLDCVFPTLRIRGRIALIGINTAYPCGLHLATGKIGTEQLKRLEALLKQLSGQHLFRIILIHHPPVQDVVSYRKSLIDAAALRKILEQYRTELLLFGHTHTALHSTLNTPSGIIRAMGAPSASSLSREYKRRSRYYLYTITSTIAGWRIKVNERVFSLKQNCFIEGQQYDFSLPA